MHVNEMNLKSVNGHAIATIDIPAHSREVEIAFSPIEGCAIAAVQAWNAVRGSGDASFELCDPSYRSALMAHAESVYKGVAPLEGDTALALFEQEVARIRAAQLKVKADALRPVVVAPAGPKIGVLESSDSNVHPSQVNPAIGEHHRVGLKSAGEGYVSDSKPAIGGQDGQLLAGQQVHRQPQQDGYPPQVNPNNELNHPGSNPAIGANIRVDASRIPQPANQPHGLPQGEQISPSGDHPASTTAAHPAQLNPNNQAQDEHSSQLNPNDPKLG